jgi:hypothetical protein
MYLAFDWPGLNGLNNQLGLIGLPNIQASVYMLNTGHHACKGKAQSIAYNSAQSALILKPCLSLAQS